MTHDRGEHSLKISALPVCYKQCLEDSELKDYQINIFINHEGVYGLAPATPGLLKIDVIFFQYIVSFYT